MLFEELLKNSDTGSCENYICGQGEQVQALLKEAISIGSREDEYECKSDSDDNRSNANYNLRAKGEKIEKSKNTNDIKPRARGRRQGQSQEEGSDSIYFIEKIIDKKKINGKEHYLVKWVGFPHSRNTWEPYSSFCSKAIVERFNKKLQRKNQPNGQNQPSKDANVIKNSPKSSNKVSHELRPRRQSSHTSYRAGSGKRRSLRLIQKEVKEEDIETFQSTTDDVVNENCCVNNEL